MVGGVAGYKFIQQCGRNIRRQAVVVCEVVIDANQFFAPSRRRRHGLRDSRNWRPVGKYTIRCVGVRDERQECRANRTWHYFIATDLRASWAIRGLMDAENGEISGALGIRRNVLKNRGGVLLPPPFF